MKRSLWIGIMVLAAACGGWRMRTDQPPAGPRDELHPLPPPSARLPGAVDLEIGAPGAPREELAASSKEVNAIFASDLGPEELDVSDYPLQQQRNYPVYAQACSRCHGLARSLNAPPTSRRWWRFYVLSMRMRASFRGHPLTREETAATLDFLEYDETRRKSTPEFRKLENALDARFQQITDQRVEAFYRNFKAPRQMILPPEER